MLEKGGGGGTIFQGERNCQKQRNNGEEDRWLHTGPGYMKKIGFFVKDNKKYLFASDLRLFLGKFQKCCKSIVISVLIIVLLST